MKILVFHADTSGCFYYRSRLPSTELKRYGVETTFIPAVPISPYNSTFNQLFELISQYDLVIVQRCPRLEAFRPIRDVCDFLNRPLVFDTDDDYLNIPTHNPGYAELGSKEQGEKYKEILRLADAITVTNRELAGLVYEHNKNIKIFPNNVESIPAGEIGSPKKDLHPAKVVDGSINITKKNGLISVPAYYKSDSGEIKRIIRIGYTATPSHIADFETIRIQFERLVDKYSNKLFIVMIGSPHFHTVIAGKGRRIVPIHTTAQYEEYMNHIRNLDIGIAPLERNLFNMSKSQIKAVEYGAWGVPAVLPNYVTYAREFTHEKNCLFYNNSKEFFECVEELINNNVLRDKLGTAARDLVRDRRLERLHTKERYEFYKSLTDSKRKVYMHTPENKE